MRSLYGQGNHVRFTEWLAVVKSLILESGHFSTEIFKDFSKVFRKFSKDFPSWILPDIYGTFEKVTEAFTIKAGSKTTKVFRKTHRKELELLKTWKEAELDKLTIKNQARFKAKKPVAWLC